MRDQSTCEYVVLGYASDSAQEELSPVVVAARTSSDDRRGLMLHVPSVLGTIASKRHLDLFVGTL
jgi:hypothetical protein